MPKKEDDLLNSSVEKEAEFFDKIYTDTDIEHRDSNYQIPEELIRQVTNPNPRSLIDREYACAIMGDLEGKKLLDYGAGDGWNSVCFAKAKAMVWAIDVSEKGIALIEKKALANGVSKYLTAEIGNCYKTRFENDMFDIVYGGGVLHHLDLELAGQELRRILHSDGVAVFYEPIRETKIIDIIKVVVLRIIRRKPSEESEDETPLTMKRIKLLKQYFGIVNCRKFNALSNAHKLFKSEKLRLFLLWIDALLMKSVPGFEKLCTAVVIELRLPKK